MVRRTGISALILAAFLALAAEAGAGEVTCSVRYLSADHVYLDVGSGAGLAVGLPVRVVRDGQVIAELEVVYTAEQSASCKIISQTGEIRTGDSAVFQAVVPPADTPAEAVVPVTSRTRANFQTSSGARPGSGPRVTGTLAVTWDHMDQDPAPGLESNLYTLPFRVRVADLGGEMEIRARGAVRRIQRKNYGASTPASEWRNRIQEVALVRRGRDLTWHFAVGRVGGVTTATAGPLDGISFSGRLGSGIRLGAFGGFAPEWGDLGFGTEDQLAGVTFHWNQQTGPTGMLDMIVAGIGRYTQGEISREYVTMTTTWRADRRLSLLQAAEVDINRGWRKEGGVAGVTMSSVALTGRYRFGRGVDVNLGYDDRVPVRTWETRSLPDSLFTEAGRVGWRAGLNLRTSGGMGLNLSGTLRDDDQTRATNTSWNVRAYAPDWPAARVTLDASVRGFDGTYMSGWAPMLGVSKVTTGGLSLRLEGGYFGYNGKLSDQTRSNTWAKFGLAQDFAVHWSVGGDYRRDWGDDIAGNNWYLEMRYRF